MKQLLLHLWSLRREFIRYFVIGLSAFVIDIGSLYLLKTKFGLSPVVSVIINQFFIINYVFFLNKHWSFGGAGPTHRQMVRFYFLAMGNYLIAVGWIWLLSHRLGVNYLLARTSNIICAVAWNFLLYKYWVYKVVGEQGTRNKQN